VTEHYSEHKGRPGTPTGVVWRMGLMWNGGRWKDTQMVVPARDAWRVVVDVVALADPWHIAVVVDVCEQLRPVGPQGEQICHSPEPS